MGTFWIVPVLQTIILLAAIVSVTILGKLGVVDAAAVTGIIGAIVGSVGVLAGVEMGHRRRQLETEAEAKP